VNVIRSHFDRQEQILSVSANLLDCFLNDSSLLCIKYHGSVLELNALGALQSWSWQNIFRAGEVMFASHRPALITMKPRTVASKRNEIGLWKLVVVEVSHVAI